MRAAGDCTRCIASREAGHSRKVARRGGAQALTWQRVLARERQET